MKIAAAHETAMNQEADAIVIGIHKDAGLSGIAQAIDTASDGTLSRLIELEEIDGSAFSVSKLYALKGVRSPLVVVVGLGEFNEPEANLAFRAAGTAAKALATRERKRVAFFLELENLEDVVAGAMVGFVGQDLYRRDRKFHSPAELVFSIAEGDTQELLQSGQCIGEAVNLAREWVNRPANDIYPESMEQECRRISESLPLELEVWDESRLAKENCGALLAVAQGSVRPPRMITMSYWGADKGQPALTLVGKGVTFDSGGLSLKPSDAMIDMKCDMAGSATVIAAVQAIAKLELPINVRGIIGCVENMVSGNSFKLGDVVRARSGTTIEILNTDAEGRLVLADCLDVALEKGASKLVDLATLTGACMVALGRNHAGLMTNHQDWCDEVSAAARHCGEPVWQLPMDKEFNEQIKSNVADIKNVGDGRWGGATTAAKLLEEFVGDVPWTHIDIAGPSFADKPSPWIDAGASGCLVRTLIQLAREQSKS